MKRKRVLQKGKKCSKFGRIIYNHQNNKNKDGRIIHLALDRWKKKVLNRHADMLERFDDILETVESGKPSFVGKGRIRYLRDFRGKPLVEVVVLLEECNKYCIIHAMNVRGRVTSIRRLRRRR